MTRAGEYLSQLFGLSGKSAVVIGAGGLLSSEMSLGFARAGARVAALDLSLAAATATAERIRLDGGEAEPFQVDVRDRESLDRALGEVLRHFGDVDILVNGAGINAPTPYLEISLDEWNSILATNLTGTFLACQVFGAHMVSRAKGSIVNISSTSADPPLSKAFTYSVSKAGVINLTRNLAREWAPSKVRVNALRPGFFPTDWSRRHFIDGERERAILGHTPMGRYGEPGELVGAVLWMCSDAASFLTGAVIAVDGGFSAMTI